MPDIPGIDPPLAEAEGGRASPVGTVGCVLPSALPRRALHTTPAAAPTRSKMTAAAVTIMYRRTCPPPWPAGRSSTSSSSRPIGHRPPVGYDRSGRPIDLDGGVVYLLQGVGIAVLDLDVAALLGDHVEQRAASQLVGLPHDAEVPGRDVADASLVDFEGARGCRVLGEGCRDFLADGELGEL